MEKMKYYKISKKDDKYGLLPSAEVKSFDKHIYALKGDMVEYDKIRFYDKDFVNLFPANSFWDEPRLIIFEFGYYWNRPPRFGDYARNSIDQDYTDSAVIIVSKYFKEILERFHLAEHRFYPVEFHFDITSKEQFGDIHEDFYIFQLLPFKEEEYFDVFAYRKVTTDFYFDENDEKISYEKSICNVIFSEIIVKALEKVDFVGVSFEEIKDKEILEPTKELQRINESKVIAKELELNPTIRPILKDIVAINHLEKLHERRLAILEKTDLVANYYKNLGDNEKITPVEQEIRNKEIELNVVLPNDYRNLLKKGGLVKNIGEYTCSNQIKFIEQVDEIYHKTNPEMVKSIFIGHNGCGDSIHYILKEDSEFILDERVVQFEHESAELYIINHTLEELIRKRLWERD